jgi:serine/threonine protein kinase
LKFMKYRDHFERELFCRRMLSSKVPAVSSDELHAAVIVPDLNLSVKDDGIATIPTAVKKISSEEEVGDSRFVLPILRTHNSEEDCEFKYEVDIKGFGEYPYCLVMDAADRSLADVMTHEDVAGKDWKQIRLIMEQIIENLDQMHSRGFIHGDMKPQNIVRDSARMKLIDLESSVCYTDGQFAGVTRDGSTSIALSAHVNFSLCSLSAWDWDNGTRARNSRGCSPSGKEGLRASPPSALYTATHTAHVRHPDIPRGSSDARYC